MAKRKTKLRPYHISRHKVACAAIKVIANIRPSVVVAATGLAYTTIQKLRMPVSEGGTLSPHLNTIARIGQAFGYELKMVERNETAVARARQLYEPTHTNGSSHVLQ